MSKRTRPCGNLQKGFLGRRLHGGDGFRLLPAAPEDCFDPNVLLRPYLQVVAAFL